MELVVSWFETTELFEEGTFLLLCKKRNEGVEFLFSESCNISLTAASNFEKYGLEFLALHSPKIVKISKTISVS